MSSFFEKLYSCRQIVPVAEMWSDYFFGSCSALRAQKPIILHGYFRKIIKFRCDGGDEIKDCFFVASL